MTLKVKAITPKIMLVSDDQVDLAEYFIRFQEYYESPKFKGITFTLGEVRSYFSMQKGWDAYNKDWILGYNFPSYALKPFAQGLFDPLTEKEVQIVNLFKYRTDDFYVIGANNERAVDHEICHGMFYTNSEYRKKMTTACLEMLDDPEVEIWITNIRLGYDESVVLDELHAYHTEKEAVGYNKIKVYQPLRDKLLKIREEFDF